MEIPVTVGRASALGKEIGFELSSEPVAGRLLSMLAAAVPEHGRILEIGTGVGVGLGWITYGLGARADVSVVSVEIDPLRAACVRRQEWPEYVQFIEASIFDLYATIGSFDLIFADSGAGKWDGRPQTMAAVRPGGVLLMDDMTPPRWHFEKHKELNREVRQDLLSQVNFVCAELSVATGILIAVRRRKTEANLRPDRTRLDAAGISGSPPRA